MTECQRIYDVIPDHQTTENKDSDNSYYALIQLIESHDKKAGHMTGATGYMTDASAHNYEDIRELNKNFISSSGDLGSGYKFTHCPAYESTTSAPTAHAQ